VEGWKTSQPSQDRYETKDLFSPPRKMPQNNCKFPLDCSSDPDFLANIALSKEVTLCFTEKEEQTQGWLPTFQDGQKFGSLTGRNLERTESSCPD